MSDANKPTRRDPDTERLNATQAAYELGVSRNRFARIERELPAVIVIGRRKYWTRPMLRAYLAPRPTKTVKRPARRGLHAVA